MREASKRRSRNCSNSVRSYCDFFSWSPPGPQLKCDLIPFSRRLSWPAPSSSHPHHHHYHHYCVSLTLKCHSEAFRSEVQSNLVCTSNQSVSSGGQNRATFRSRPEVQAGCLVLSISVQFDPFLYNFNWNIFALFFVLFSISFIYTSSFSPGLKKWKKTFGQRINQLNKMKNKSRNRKQAS